MTFPQQPHSKQTRRLVEAALIRRPENVQLVWWADLRPNDENNPIQSPGRPPWPGAGRRQPGSGCQDQFPLFVAGLAFQTAIMSGEP